MSAWDEGFEAELTKGPQHPVILRMKELGIGYTPQPNWVLAAKYLLPDPAIVLLDYIHRKTWGWRKFDDFISYSQFRGGGVPDAAGSTDRGTGLSYSTIKKYLTVLIDANLVMGEGKSKKGIKWTPTQEYQPRASTGRS